MNNNCFSSENSTSQVDNRGYVITFTFRDFRPCKKLEIYFTSSKDPHMISVIQHNQTAEAGEMSSIPTFYKLDDTYCMNRILAEAFRDSSDGEKTPRTITRVNRMPQPTSRTLYWPQANKKNIGGSESVCKLLLEEFDKDPESVQLDEAYVSKFRYSQSFIRATKTVEIIHELKQLRSAKLDRKVFANDGEIKKILRYIYQMKDMHDIITKLHDFKAFTSVSSFDSFLTRRKILKPTTDPNVWEYRDNELFWIPTLQGSTGIAGCKSSFEREIRKHATETYGMCFSVSTGTDTAPMWDIKDRHVVLKKMTYGHREFRAGDLIQQSKVEEYTLGVYVPNISSYLSASDYKLLEDYGVI